MRTFFEIIIGKKQGDTFEALYRLFCAAIALVILVFAINIIVNDPKTLGPWGDFFGGVLNPLLTFLTFTGLLITIMLQQKELNDSRIQFKRSADALALQNKEINKQSFESTFFNMLILHNNIVNSIMVSRPNGVTLTGRDCFNTFYTELSDTYKSRLKKQNAPYSGDMTATIQQAYKIFWRIRQRKLGHYYRYLYNVIRFVKESEYREGPYIRIIRAQLSDQELLLLYYNCLTPMGERFKKLAEDFSLFNNLDPLHLLERSHKVLVEEKAFGHKVEN